MPPALKAKVADHWWTYEELVALIDKYEDPARPEKERTRLQERFGNGKFPAITAQ